MSGLWLWLIVNLFFNLISLSQSRYIRLPPANCSELSPIGTPITQLLNILPTSNWEFTFLTRTSVLSYFLLDDLKGTITVKRSLDREDLCRTGICSCSNECLLKLEINAISDTYTHIIYLPIIVLDENDNYCYFLNNIYYLNITENVRLNTRIILPIGYDPDQTPNNIQSYSFRSNNYTEFQLDQQLPPSIIVIKSLDRELVDRYYFTYCAYEGILNEKRSCCTKIVLTITDVNDNSPKFQSDQQSRLILNISELTPINTELIQMKASDPDDGINGKIKYTFSKWTLNDVTINEIFYLNPDNGSIILLKKFDYEQRNSYELQIQAKDLGLNSIPTYTTLLIQIIDENDCIPEMFIFSPADVQLINNSIIYILENTSLSTPVLYLTVSDRDSGENGRVTIELILSNPIIRLEKLTENTYVLKTNEELDREKQSNYTFELLLYDHGQPQQTIEYPFLLDLIDINDCSPSFGNLTNYTFYINENNQENLLIHTFKVHDSDEQDHVTLKLSDNNQIFELNQENQFILLKSLDYERQSSYGLTLTAEDSVGHHTSIPIFIYVEDLNDNPVKFLQNFLQFQIDENQVNQTFLTNIHAEDNDIHDKIIYTIDSDDINQINQYIDLKSNGNLYTKQSFDHEIISNLKFRIIANDSLHTDFISIEIKINDLNDNKPVLLNQSPLCYIYNKTTDFIHLELEGYDPDENENGNISYSLINSSSMDLILYSNGSIIVPGKIQEYIFDIYLKDNGKIEVLSTFYENFILLIVSNASQCRNHSIISLNQFNQQTFIYLISIILISLACFTIIILFICCCLYIRQQKARKNLLKHQTPSPPMKNLTPSFSSSLNDDAENDTLLLSSPSPQFTAMTTVSSSTTTTNDSARLTTFTDRIQTNKSSSLSSSSSSTYVKMSRSFEDEML